MYLQRLLQLAKYYLMGGFSCIPAGCACILKSSQTWSLASATGILSGLVACVETGTAGGRWTVMECS